MNGPGANGSGSATTAITPPPRALLLLLQRVVDYAGLFPPASLDMSAAIAEYAKQRDGDDGWMLGRFVLPAARLEEFASTAAPVLPREGSRSWALSALLASDIEEDIERIERFNASHRDARLGAVHVDTVELKTQTPRDVARAGSLLDRRFDTYMEIPIADDPAELVAAIAETTAKAKVRTGGVTTDAFPQSAHLVRFIMRCLAHEVAFKATAGLHHPWRAEYRLTYAPDAEKAPMFGFLNVLLCTALLRAGAGEAAAMAVLEERNERGDAIRVDEDGIRWRDRLISFAEISRARDSMASFGSCSIAEPIADLRNLALL